MPRSGALKAGNVNLKGKKYKLLRCRCCVVQDFREEYFKKVSKKEVAYELTYDANKEIEDYESIYKWHKEEHK